MKNKGQRVGIVFSLLMFVAGAAQATTIRYLASDLIDTTPGEDLWSYQYQVSGRVFSANSGFDILFSVDDGFQFGDLQDLPASPNPDWDVIGLQADPNLPDDGRYDALALVDGASLNDLFTIEFIWRGAGAPASQDFEIFGANLAVIDSGRTVPFGAVVPEPGAAILLAAGLMALQRSRKRPHPA